MGGAGPGVPLQLDVYGVDPKLFRHGEDDILFPTRDFLGDRATQLLQAFDNVVNQHFRRGSTSSHADDLAAFQPLRVDLAGLVDQVGRGSHPLRQFPQAVGVGAVGGAHYQHQVAVTGELLDGVLAVLGGVADVVLAGAFDLGEFLPQGVYDTGSVIHGEGGLGDVGKARGILHFQTGNILLVFHQVDITAITVIVLAHGALHFRVAMVPDEDTFTAIAAVSHDFQVDLGDQRAGSVEDFQAPVGSFVLDRLGDAMGAEDHQGIVGHFVQLIHEDGAPVAQVIHHVLVVDHFVAHVDGGAEDLQGPVDDFDGSVHPGAEAAGVG